MPEAARAAHARSMDLAKIRELSGRYEGNRAAHAFGSICGCSTCGADRSTLSAQVPGLLVEIERLTTLAADYLASGNAVHAANEKLRAEVAEYAGLLHYFDETGSPFYLSNELRARVADPVGRAAEAKASGLVGASLTNLRHARGEDVKS